MKKVFWVLYPNSKAEFIAEKSWGQSIHRIHNSKTPGELWEEEQSYWKELLNTESNLQLHSNKILSQESGQNSHIKEVRGEITDFMFELSDNLGLKNFTTQTAIVYLDKLINKFDMSKVLNQAQLWAISLLLVSSKFNEVDTKIPYIDDFRNASAK